MGLDDDTIVVFTTDNGTENFTWPDGGQTPFAGGKGTVLEGGFRVPVHRALAGQGSRRARSRTASSPGSTGSRPSSPRPATRTSSRSCKQGKTARRHDLQGPPRRLQPDGPDHRQGAVEAPRDLLLRRGHARRGADRRLQVPLHRSARTAGSAARSSPTGRSWSTCGSIRSSAPAVRHGPSARCSSTTGSRTSSGASSSSSRRSAKLAQTCDRVPADAEGRELQPRGREGADPRSPRRRSATRKSRGMGRSPRYRPLGHSPGGLSIASHRRTEAAS